MRNGFETITLLLGTEFLIKVEQMYRTGQIIIVYMECKYL